MFKNILPIALILMLCPIAFGQTVEYHGVCVGINYPGTGNVLKWAVADAQGIKQTLLANQSWLNGNVTLKLDADATKQHILDANSAMPRSTGYTDLFHFSGHGTTSGLTTVDLMNLSPSDLQDSFGSFNQYTAWLDACHSGVFAQNMTTGVILAACEPYEGADESDALGHGVFSYYLIQGLTNDVAAGGNGLLSAQGLFDYAAPRTTAYDPYMHPRLQDNCSGDLVLNLNIYVPQQYSTISSALSASHSGQTVVLSSGSQAVTNSLTVSSGVTLVIKPAVTVSFSSGTSLTINGTLNAVGTSSQTITFDRSGTSGTWGGIYFAWGSGGTIDHCTVQNVLAYGGGAINMTGSSPTIQYSTIQNTSGGGDGISASYYSSPYIFHNTIRNNSRHGVYFNNASGFLIQNNITATASTGNAAVYCYLYSNPLFSYTSQPYLQGRNTLTGGYYGVYAGYYSVPCAGYGGTAIYNRFFGNSYANAYAEVSSTLYAQYDWWGQSPPNASKIIATGGSVIYYQPYLTSDPGPAFKMLPTAPIENLPIILAAQTTGASSTVITPATGDLRELLLQARGLRLQNQYANAIGIYKAILSTAPDSNQAIIALVELGSVYKEIRSADIISYIGSFALEQNRFRPVALELLANAYAADGNTSAASAANNSLVSDFAGTVHEKNGLLNQFYLHFVSHQFSSAHAVLSQLLSKYGTDSGVMLASWLMHLTGQDEPPAPRQKPEISLSTSSTDPEKLVNFPNPFNPTTTVQYWLPSSGHVTLRVYNTLGQEVATLVDGIQDAGFKSVTFDASRLSSGVYVYRLQAGAFIQNRKMLLVK